MAKTPPNAKKQSRVPMEGKGLILLGFSLLLLLSLLSFYAEEPNKNWIGLAGWGLAWGFNFLFGLCSYFLVIFMGWLGWQFLLSKEISSPVAKCIYFGMLLVSCSLLLNLFAEWGLPLATLLEHKIYTETYLFDLPYPHRATRYNLGGVPLYYLYKDLPTVNLQRLLSDVGVCLTFFDNGASVLPPSHRDAPAAAFLDAIKQKLYSAKGKIGALLEKTSPKNSAELPLMTGKSSEEIEKVLAKHLPQPLYQPRKGKEEEVRIRTMNDKMEAEKKKPWSLNFHPQQNGNRRSMRKKWSMAILQPTRSRRQRFSTTRKKLTSPR